MHWRAYVHSDSNTPSASVYARIVQLYQASLDLQQPCSCHALGLQPGYAIGDVLVSVRRQGCW
jgi:hypothetical protein